MRIGSYLMLPTKGHFEQAMYIIVSSRKYNRLSLVLNHTLSCFDKTLYFKALNWSQYYQDAEKLLLSNQLETRGKSVLITCLVERDHVGCIKTRRLHTGVQIL